MENLSELATIYPNVKILHFDVDIKNSRLDFKVIFLNFFWLEKFTLVWLLLTENLIHLISFNSRMDQDMYHTMAFC